MNVVVRRAESAEEIEAAGAITAEAYLADRLVTNDDAYLVELTDARRRATEAILLVALVPRDEGDPGAEPDVVVGSITLAPPGSSYAEIAEPGELELRMLGVAPEARGHGVAEALMRATVREAVLLGYRRVVLSTEGQMAAAQRLYGRLGWTRVPERDWGHVEIHLRVYTWRASAPPGPLVERATWPPVRVERVEGFELGMTEGITRRANSAVLTGEAWDSLDAAELGRRLTAVEAAYELVGLAPCVRVDSPVPREGQGPTAADRVLVARGYRDFSETFLLVRALDGPTSGEPVGDAVLPDGVSVRVERAPDGGWLDVWAGDRALERSTGRRILTGTPAHYLTAVRDGEAVGVIRVCLVDGSVASPGADSGEGPDLGTAGPWAGLSCLTVAPSSRGNGLARILTQEALAVARAAGAERAFSQVLVGNAAAITLHERLGFAVAGAYRYAERAR